MIFSCTEFRRLLFGFQGAPPLLRSAAALTAGGLLLVAPAAAAEFFLWMGWIVVILSVPALLPGKGSGGHARLRPLLLLFPAAAAICLVAFRHDRLAIWAAAIWAGGNRGRLPFRRLFGENAKVEFQRNACRPPCFPPRRPSSLPCIARKTSSRSLRGTGSILRPSGLFTPTIMKR